MKHRRCMTRSDVELRVHVLQRLVLRVHMANQEQPTQPDTNTEQPSTPQSASATFENGELKIEMEANDDDGPRARRIEVREGSPH